MRTCVPSMSMKIVAWPTNVRSGRGAAGPAGATMASTRSIPETAPTGDGDEVVSGSPVVCGSAGVPGLVGCSTRRA